MKHLFFFNDTATTEIYPLSLHDALPISTIGLLWVEGVVVTAVLLFGLGVGWNVSFVAATGQLVDARSEEHTSEIQSRQYLVCRLLLEKKKNTRLPQSSEEPTSDVQSTHY